MPVTVTTSPGMHASTRSWVNSHSTVRGTRPSSWCSDFSSSWILTVLPNHNTDTWNWKGRRKTGWFMQNLHTENILSFECTQMLEWYLIFWKSTSWAVDLIGLKIRLLHACISHFVGGENFPSGKSQGMVVPHLAHEKLICITRGRTVLTLTTVPLTETSLSMILTNYAIILQCCSTKLGMSRNYQIQKC